MPLFIKLLVLSALVTVLGGRLWAAEAGAPQIAVVTSYNQALIEADGEALSALMASNVTMFNGAGSASLSDWEPHMFLSGEEVEQ